MPYFGEMEKRISLNKSFFCSSALLGYSLALFKIMRRRYAIHNKVPHLHVLRSKFLRSMWFGNT